MFGGNSNWRGPVWINSKFSINLFKYCVFKHFKMLIMFGYSRYRYGEIIKEQF